jgi:hypothetical protein
MCPLNMWEAYNFLLMLLKKRIRSTCYLNNMWFLYANGYMSILYAGCKKFPTNRFVGNLCPIYIGLIIVFVRTQSHIKKMIGTYRAYGW